MALLKSRNQWIEDFNEKHGNKYKYVFSEIKASLKIDIICLIHGTFKQRASAHLEGQGCPDCKGSLISLKVSCTEKEILSKFKEVHRRHVHL